jgi:dihydrodipicolinate synthase/N-acetylneuraminate lyase
VVIPAHPLALTARRTLDERRQAALTRYYIDAGAGGLAVGVHTTQFRIREHGLLRPVLGLAREATLGWKGRREVALIAGVVGTTRQALDEAGLAHASGYDAVLLSLAALRDAPDAALIRHCRRVAEVLPVIGFYLQPAVGGRALDFRFWREFAEIPNVVAIKIAPFNRYQTLDVVRAVVEAGRDDIALYTGNDDNIVCDLLTPFAFQAGGRVVRRRIVGGLLGQWAVWTRQAVELLDEIRAAPQGRLIDQRWLTRAAALTDANGAIFDARNGFAGCLPGIHEVLRRQGLLAGTWCLDTHERLSAGQAREIDRVIRSYPDLTDDAFVAAHRERWLNG